METVSQEVYELVKAQVLAEIEAKKQEKRRIDLAADAVFAQAKRKYADKLAEKYGRGKWTWEVSNKFDLAKKTALECLGFKNARAAYLAGYGEDANKLAEEILEVMTR